VFLTGVVVKKVMGSVPGKQRPSSFVETIQVQSAPMEDSPTRHGECKVYAARSVS